MFCCPICIGDRHLSRQRIPALSTSKGKCDYCGSADQKLLEPSKLSSEFELVINIYEECGDGERLVRLLRNDWGLLAGGGISEADADRLLEAIAQGGSFKSKLYRPSEDCKTDSLAAWEQFKVELVHANRYFPKLSIDKERIEAYLPLLKAYPEDIPKVMYRARVQTGNEIFDIGQMGAPPLNLTTHGRANPAGIPYLYLASDEVTAISEVRPHTGETASVASFRIPEEIKLVDLRNPKQTISPFVLEEEVSQLYGHVEFLVRLGEELTRPVLPSAAAYDYVPSQYLCEFIKNIGYQGVIYKSSVSDGMNVAVFDPNVPSPIEVKQRHITKVLVESRDL